ncbi:hypothetical protein KL942_002184 [Ogataea angusta]|uniref:Vacuolar protein-sorting-associated protein 36 n=1 Tax=Pichia angusta TaxID=870730 RepID=A0ABQ7RYI4_PICAN|nr:hypothetical protein KL942_002184 [Ogataea angusta]KAG7848615.1 hypothetical protein KL941_001433 [Ogataea angusta]KAG7850141.1 hypothetical protein KL940_001701 [Ogataea angusta]KAG7860591.1 hypothetical protein KL939_002077 [Ogataea angusta]
MQIQGFSFTSEFWEYAQLTNGGRPVCSSKERSLFLTANVGLYLGNSKIENYQNGRLYLTNLRLIYVPYQPNEALEKKIGLSLNLAYIENVQFQAGFMRSSPKILLILTQISPDLEQETLHKTLNWDCPICFQSNKCDLKVGSRFNVPKCEVCGVSANVDELNKLKVEKQIISRSKTNKGDTNIIPNSVNRTNNAANKLKLHEGRKPNSLKDDLSNEISLSSKPVFCMSVKTDATDRFCFKLSFRDGGARIFYDKLKFALGQAKWLRADSKLQVNAGALRVARNISATDADIQSIPSNVNSKLNFDSTEKRAGIHGLETLTSLRNTEVSTFLNSSLRDLQNLMDKSKDLAKIGDDYRRMLMSSKILDEEVGQAVELLSRSRNSLKLLGNLLNDRESINEANDFYTVESLNLLKQTGGAEAGSSLYVEELSRQLYDFIIEENIIGDKNGLITALDLYCLFNKRKGFYSISPRNFLLAIISLERLNPDLQLIELKLQSLQKIERGTAREIPEKARSLYAICSSTMNAKSISRSVLDVLESVKFEGYSALEFQGMCSLQTNLLLLQSVLNALTKDGVLCVDSTLQGEKYYKNEILHFEAQS